MSDTPSPRRIPADAWFPSRIPAIQTRTCSACKGDASTFKDDLSRAEYGLSGLCQRCQDAVFDPNPDRCAWCGDGRRDDLGAIEAREDGEYSHAVCWRLELVGMPIEWPAGAKLPATPAPWAMHREEAPEEERFHTGSRYRWHIAREADGRHACVAVVGREADARLLLALASGADRAPELFGDDAAPLPWKLVEERGPDRHRSGWHLYSTGESGGEHICVGTVHHLADAIWVASSGSQALIDLATDALGKER